MTWTQRDETEYVERLARMERESARYWRERKARREREARRVPTLRALREELVYQRKDGTWGLSDKGRRAADIMGPRWDWFKSHSENRDAQKKNRREWLRRWLSGRPGARKQVAS